MPAPRENEIQDAFISRCMSDGEAKNSFPDEKQRVAFCHSQCKNKKSKSTRMDELLESIKATLSTNK